MIVFAKKQTGNEWQNETTLALSKLIFSQQATQLPVIHSGTPGEQ